MNLHGSTWIKKAETLGDSDLKELMTDSVPVHIICPCGTNLVVHIGKYESDDYCLLEEHPEDHMEDIWGFHCPVCGKYYRIKSKYIRTLHFDCD